VQERKALFEEHLKLLLDVLLWLLGGHSGLRLLLIFIMLFWIILGKYQFDTVPN
jgi:hypothetical protein